MGSEMCIRDSSYRAVLEMTECERVETTTRKRQLWFAGALVRQEGTRLPRCLMNGRLTAQGPKEVGRPPKRRDSHLDIRIKRCILLNVIVPKLEYAGEVWEGNKKFAEKLKTVQMSAARKILGCSKTTSNTALRAELGRCTLSKQTET